jgi:hypothetical protein
MERVQILALSCTFAVKLCGIAGGMTVKYTHICPATGVVQHKSIGVGKAPPAIKTGCCAL